MASTTATSSPCLVTTSRASSHQYVQIVVKQLVVEGPSDHVVRVLCVQPLIAADKGLLANYKQNVNDALKVLPKLSAGLDINAKFTG